MIRLIDNIPATIHELCLYLKKQGATAWLVGGCVRDLCLDINPKDYDLEVYGLAIPKLEHCLKKLGHCQQVGKSFAVLKLSCQGMNIDLALPRTEKKTGMGHRAFEVIADENLALEEASQRRDFTMNAMMINPLSAEFMDFHQGREDLEQGILRHVSPAFAEDPLRVLRAMQFAARFKLTLHPSTAALCQALLPEAASLSDERIWSEWEKWADAPYPSYGLKCLKDSSWWNLYPELQALEACPQDPEWHPEGNVWIHTCYVSDEAAHIALRYGWQGKEKICLIFAALCHDLGKPSTTTHDTDHIRSRGHSQAGVEPMLSFCEKIAAPQWLSAHLAPLIKEHLCFHGASLSHKSVRRLAVRLEPSNIEIWEALTEADLSGRPPLKKSRPAVAWLQMAQELQFAKNKPAMMITGKVLIAHGIASGPSMGVILRDAYEAQLDGCFENETEAAQWLKQDLKNRNQDQT
ncbi:MAG: HDIG domain-containing protein [Mariprofundaceae bacterium]|nr:HDIG domain-containing protein [Mariprofundaceae bacterium]